jgi:hypothetical protein
MRHLHISTGDSAIYAHLTCECMHAKEKNLISQLSLGAVVFFCFAEIAYSAYIKIALPW